jgi:hypothetical protein
MAQAMGLSNILLSARVKIDGGSKQKGRAGSLLMNNCNIGIVLCLL